jgi:hypothetical protein
MFQAETQAYLSDIQAKEAEWKGYTAAVAGEAAKVQVYEAGIQAYRAQVDSYKAAAEVKIEQMKAVATHNVSLTNAYEAQLKAYAAGVEAQSVSAKTAVEVNSNAIQAYQVTVQAAQARSIADAERYKAITQVALESAKGDLMAKVEDAKARTEKNAALVNVAIAQAKVSGDLASGAMSGIVTLAAETITKEE